MPAQQTRITFAAHMKSSVDQAIREHADDKTMVTGGRLPPGINRGTAQLVDLYFDVYKTGVNKGKLCLKGSATCMFPESIATDQGVTKTRGLLTYIIVPADDMKETDGSVTKRNDNIVNKVMPRLRSLGGEDITAGVSTGADIDRIVNLLKQSKPFFYFSTSERVGRKKPDGTKEPDGVWENWYEAADQEEVQRQLSGVQQSGMNDEYNQSTTAEPEPVTTPTPTQRSKPSTNGTQSKEQELPDDPVMLVSIIQDDKSDPTLATKSFDKLKGICLEAGMTEDQFNEYSFEQTLEFFQSKPEESHEEPSSEWYVTEGTPCYTQVYNIRTKKTDKQVECEIVKYDPKDDTVILKDMGTNKMLENPQTKKPMGPVSVEKIQQVPY